MIGIYQSAFSFVPSNPRYDLFMGTFSTLKVLFTSLDSIKYFRERGWNIH